MTKRYEKPLTSEELAARSEADIDYSDIPALDDAFWAKAKVSPPRTKPNVSLRLSQEVIEYFKSQHPRGYTTHMAAVLSAYVEAQQPKS